KIRDGLCGATVYGLCETALVGTGLGRVGGDEAAAPDHGWVHGLLHGDVDVRGGPGGRERGGTVCGSAWRGWPVDTCRGGFGFPRWAGTHHGGGLEREAGTGNTADSRRDEFEGLLGRDSNRSNARRERNSHGGSAAGEGVAGV